MGLVSQESPVEVERRRRIRVSLWAYAYEIQHASLVDDATFDREALLINPAMETGHSKLDKFFRESFAPHTGMWVNAHPDLAGLEKVYKRVKGLQ